MKKGKQVEITIEDIDFPAKGFAMVDGLKVYAKNTFPGQKVSGTVSKKRKDYVEIKVREVVERAPYEIEPTCDHYGISGGCLQQVIPYEKQLEFKTDEVKKLFTEANRSTGEFLGIEGSPTINHYRNKMEYSFGDESKGGDLNLGMHMVGKRFGIVNIAECCLTDDDFAKISRATLEYFRKAGLSYYRVMARTGFLRHLVVRKAQITGEIMVNLVTTTQVEFDLTEYTKIIQGLEFDGVLKSVLHTENDSLSDTVSSDKVNILFGEDYITEELLGLKFKIYPLAFFQTNSLGAEKLYSLVRDFMGDADNKEVFDLYCGTGTIGQIAAGKASKVTGVELIEEAVVAANENAKLNGLDNCTFIAGDVDVILRH
jgi:23S rRNA (uracil-5-)-methyltransferase RumA